MLYKNVLKYNTQSFQVLFQHSTYKSHSTIAKLRFSNKQVDMKKGARKSSNFQSVLDHSKSDKVLAAEIMEWSYSIKLQSVIFHWDLVVIYHHFLKMCSVIVQWQRSLHGAGRKFPMLQVLGLHYCWQKKFVAK